MVTLTYADAPKELVPEDMQSFLRRLRLLYPAPLRFFGVGEYGDRGGRPHFHLAMFGLSILDSQTVGKAWSKPDGTPIGYIHMGELNHLTAQYVCGYVTKKLNNKDDQALNGKHPEFARMSLRPGLGAPAIETLKRAIAPDGDLTNIYRRGDVPETIRLNGKEYPLGRYLRGKLRQAIGLDPTQPEPIKRYLQHEYVTRSAEVIEVTEKKREFQYASAHAKLLIERGKKVL